jgi:putative phage-type endonuclease
MKARAKWLEERKSGLGGSDAAAAIGVDPYRDPLALWGEKVGLIEADDLSANEVVESGNALEKAIGEWYGKKSGRKVKAGKPFTILRHAELPWMFASLDATQVVDGERSVVQIKNTSFDADAWEEALPAHYEVQLAHEMIVAGVTHGSLVALHRGQRLRVYDRKLDPDFASMLVKAEREFWENVTSQTAPAPGPNSAEAVKSLFPRAEISDIIALPPEADDLDAELQSLKEQMKALGARAEEIESQIKYWIGSREGGMTQQGIRFNWKGSVSHYEAKEARDVYVRRFTRSKGK